MRYGLGIAGGILAAALLAVAGSWMLSLTAGAAEDDARETAEAFIAAWNGGEWAALDRLTDAADGTAGEYHRDLATELHINQLSVELDMVQFEPEFTRAIFDADLEIEALGTWTYRGVFNLINDEEEGTWLVDWEPSVFHPHLTGERTLRLIREWEERAPILAVDGSTLRGDVDIRRIGIEPQQITDRAQVRNALVEVAGADAAEADELLDREDLHETWFYPVVEVSAERFAEIDDQLAAVDGVVVQEEGGRGTPNDTFGPHILGETEVLTSEVIDKRAPDGLYREGDLAGTSGLEGTFEEQLAGRPEVRLELVRPDPQGNEPLVIDVVLENPGVAPDALQTHLDPAVQAAATEAIAGIEDPAALVAVDVGTGGIRAAANNGAAEFDRALGGRYPPGSTFKVITAAAAIEHGITPETPVDCPAEVAVDGRDFRNAGDRQLGTVPFLTLFAESCNTGLISTVMDIGHEHIFAAAEAFGFNVAYDMGAPSFRASYPRPGGPVDAAAQSIGQGQVEASVAHMASVAAGAVSGTWRSPSLAQGGAQAEREVPGDPEIMRQLMGAVVSHGTGTGAFLGGEPVLGKTGSAEYGTEDPPESHAWFIGVRGDLAMAVVIEGGGLGGAAAAPAAAAFYSALDG